MTRSPDQGLSWAGVVKLGLVQCAIGAVAALTTSTLNRVSVVEAGMPAILPAALVAWHYVVQLSRPHWGHGSDQGGRRTPFIIGGMAVLVLGAIVATDAVTMLRAMPVAGIIVGLIGYSMIGAGMGAAGTSLLALLATQVTATRRPAAASMTWILMILGIVLSASVTGALLKPFSSQRLAMIASGVAGFAFLLTLFAVWGVEDRPAVASADPASPPAPAPRPFRVVLQEILTDPVARDFTLFVFVSMLAYSAQELILEPFAGLVFAMTPGQSAQLSGLQHGGVLLGMITVGVLGARVGDKRSQWMQTWTVAGCVGSAVALAGLGAATVLRPVWPLSPMVFVLGFANGVFAVSAIGSMMGLAGAGRSPSAGARMGVWGAAQAIAFAMGGFVGAAGSDALRGWLHQPAPAFLIVFGVEAVIFLIAAGIAAGIGRNQPVTVAPATPSGDMGYGRAS